MISFPFDSRVMYNGEIPIYDRAVSSQPLKNLIKDLFTTGVMPNPSDCFQVSAGTDGMTVVVAAGYAVIEGGLMQEEAPRTLEVTAADTTNDRIDTVVLRWDNNVDIRTADLYIVAGAPSASPVRPELTRSGSIYEIGIADLFIPKGSTAISNERITDTRYEAERCGIVSSVSKWDTTTIYQQVQADLASFKSEEQAEFMSWFNRMKDQLSEDAAGYLQNEIEELSEELLSEIKITTFPITTSDWTGNIDSYSSSYPYCCHIQTELYTATSHPFWQMSGANDTMPTVSDYKNGIKFIYEAAFDSAGITLYAIKQPTVDLTLVVKG